ncbi:MAG: ABC transporter ATP-binding protein [Chloroflexi bacterium]|nr:ABC transporter ATP-binding protein [Chloroflexota bacterium]
MNLDKQVPALLRVENLQKYFQVRKGWLGRKIQTLKAVDGLTFDLRRGETLGLVGESGCGKTTAGKTILRLYEPDGGRVVFDGHDVVGASEKQMLALRRQMQIVFQDPYDSLNPRKTVEQALGEPMAYHRIVERRRARERVAELLSLVGLPVACMNRYPHEFSGGQRQRIVIARALCLGPQFIVCDEAVSSLDVSIQAQIINLLQDLQTQLALTFLFISHDLRIVKHISDRVAIMYLGKIVELGRTEEIYAHPLHPYTQALLSAIPVADPSNQPERIILSGDVPTPTRLPKGCRFHTRCWLKEEICARVEPGFDAVSDDHYVMCHFSRSGKVTR